MLTRKSRRSLLQLSAFGIILLFIIFLNRPTSSKHKVFAWTTVRYRTVAATLPEARGICPGLVGTQLPALVVSRVEADGDASWLDKLASLYHLCVYAVDAPADTITKHLRVPRNRGHEAITYLTFLIDNYDHIPAAGVVFVHGSRWAWHNDAPDYDNAALLAALNITSALAPWGYHNLRCDWSASTCLVSEAPPQGSLETSFNALLEPWSARAASDAALPGALADIFGGNDEAAGRLLLGRNDAVRAQCCAQFVVSRERIWQHARAEYVALRQWLLDGSRDNEIRSSRAAPPDDRIAGRILSYVWHILFMPQSVTGGEQDTLVSEHGGVELDGLNVRACPHAGECYCRLYGRCDIAGCTSPGRCHGQYEVPPDFKLPEDWAATHT